MRGTSTAIVIICVLMGAGCARRVSPKDKIDLSQFASTGAPTEHVGYSFAQKRFFFTTNGTAAGPIAVPKDGEYTLTITASGDAAQFERAQFRVAIDGEQVGRDTTLTSDDLADYPFPVRLAAGDHTLEISFLNDVYGPGYDRNLYVRNVALKPNAGTGPARR